MKYHEAGVLAFLKMLHLREYTLAGEILNELAVGTDYEFTFNHTNPEVTAQAIAAAEKYIGTGVGGQLFDLVVGQTKAPWVDYCIAVPFSESAGEKAVGYFMHSILHRTGEPTEEEATLIIDLMTLLHWPE